MSEARSPETPRRLLSDLCRLVAERASLEGQIEADFAARNAAAEKASQEAQSRLDDRYRREKTATEEQCASARTTATTKFESEHGGLEREYEKVRADALARFAADMQAAEQALQDAHWEAVENSDAARGGLNLPLKEIFAGLDSRWQELERIYQQSVALLQQRGHWDEFPEASPPAVMLEKQPGRRFCHALEQAQVQFRRFPSSSCRKFFAACDRWGSCSCCGYWRSVRRSPFLAGRIGAGRPPAAVLPPWSASSPAPGSTMWPGENPSGPIWRCGAPCWRPGWAARACWRPPRPSAGGWTP